jgi:hypothetical protein
MCASQGYITAAATAPSAHLTPCGRCLCVHHPRHTSSTRHHKLHHTPCRHRLLQRPQLDHPALRLLWQLRRLLQLRLLLRRLGLKLWLYPQ